MYCVFSVSCIDTEKEPKPCDDNTCDYSKRLSKVSVRLEISQEMSMPGV